MKAVNDNLKGLTESRETVIRCNSWQVDEPRMVRIRKESDDLLPPLWVLGGHARTVFPELSFRRSLTVQYIHRMT